MAGRPTALTPEVQATIVAYLTDGNTIQASCALSGIAESTFHKWMARGRDANDGDAVFVEFVEAVERAMHAKDAKAHRIVTAALKEGDLSAAKWWLSFRDAQRRQDRLPVLDGPPEADKSGNAALIEQVLYESSEARANLSRILCAAADARAAATQ